MKISKTIYQPQKGGYTGKSERRNRLLAFLLSVVLLLAVALDAIALPLPESPHSAIKQRKPLFPGNDLSEIEVQYYRTAEKLAAEKRWEEAYGFLSGLGILKAKPLLIKTLYEMGRDEQLTAYVEKLNRRELLAVFEEVIVYYLLSSIRLKRYDEMVNILQLQTRFYPDIKTAIFKQILYSLIANGEYEPIIELMDIFPSGIYLEGEKNYLLGVVHFQLGYYTIARGFFNNIAPDSDFYLPSHSYRSQIYYHTKDSSGIPSSTGGLADEIKFNYALTYLLEGKTDEANSLTLQIEKQELKKLLELFIAREARHYRTAMTLLETFDELNPTEHSLTTLIMAESYYYAEKFRKAELLFKLYSNFDDADLEYANHSLGYCFKGFYRYNNTAYYWIKNLREEKSFYDSLAVYNLSLLYTHTENYGSAHFYFRSYVNKYGFPASDRVFFESYLKTLGKQGAIVTFIDVFNRYREMLSPEVYRSGLLMIANHYKERRNGQEALKYYGDYLEVEPNDTILLQVERIRFSLGHYEDSEDFILALIAKYPQSSFKKELSMDLAKFYLSQKKYAEASAFIDSLLTSYLPNAEEEDHEMPALEQTAEEMIDDDLAYGYDQGQDSIAGSLEHNEDELVLPVFPLLSASTSPAAIYKNLPATAYTDSLLFLKGIALKDGGKINEAGDVLVFLHSRLTTDSLRKQLMQRMVNTFERIETKKAVAYLNNLALYEEKAALKKDYLLILARVYEKQSLFNQANKIYLLLLGEEEEKEPDAELYYRLTVNEMRQRRYEEALRYIKLSQEATGSKFSGQYDEDLLFLSYLAHYSLGKRDEAISLLLALYYNYPHSSKKFEVTKNIVEQFIESDREVFAWYFLQEYYPQATQAERWVLDRYKNTLRPFLQEDTLAVAKLIVPLVKMGLDFHSIISDSLVYKRDGGWYSPLLETEVFDE